MLLVIVYTCTYSCEFYIILLYTPTSDQIFGVVTGKPNFVILLIVDFCELKQKRSRIKLNVLLLQNLIYCWRILCMNPPTDLKFILDPETERTLRRKSRKQMKMVEQKIQHIELGAQLNWEFENPILMANQKRIASDAILSIWQRKSDPSIHTPSFGRYPCIIRLEMQATTFELNFVMFQILQNIKKFHRLPAKDQHLPQVFFFFFWLHWVYFLVLWGMVLSIRNNWLLE